ncbi:MAG: CPBP family intramembrane metalloprotease [Hydrococcus sp. Prado102]|jgi:membrane protease YdiL (CAAX protease family)|nr:CPBP family intramembrane metalloprotease [Hydrococcus sp. Prado102]
MSFLPTIAGLCLALIGPALIASFDNYQSLTSKVLGQIVLATLAIVILGIVIFWEKQPLSSIGLHSWHWHSLIWGLAFAGFLIFIYSPLLLWAMNKLGRSGFESGLDELTKLPVWYLIFAVGSGGIVEEILYRGYATERLSGLTGSYWIGGMLCAIAFGIAHVPLWGWNAACTTVISGGLLTLFYLGTGDLLPCIIAHIITDTVGIIVKSLRSNS